MPDDLLLGALAGGGLGLGLVVVLAARRASRPTLAPRLAPYVRDARRRPAPVTTVRGPFATLGRVAAPVLRDAARVLDRLGSSTSSIRARLAVLGSTATVEQFRVEQAVWSAVALALTLLGVLLARVDVLPAVVAVVLAAVVAPLARDRLLSRAVARRRERLQEQLPDVAEMLALAVGAGESAGGALDRVARTAHGELADELRITVHEARAGTPLTAALTHLAERTAVPSISRFAEGVSVAVERGTPLADVLRAQAADARSTRRRELMELGGKKEIAMMAPVVFLILPVTVIFALFPGIAVLRVGV